MPPAAADVHAKAWRLAIVIVFFHPIAARHYEEYDYD